MECHGTKSDRSAPWTKRKTYTQQKEQRTRHVLTEAISKHELLKSANVRKLLKIHNRTQPSPSFFAYKGSGV